MQEKEKNPIFIYLKELKMTFETLFIFLDK